jgi:Tfp pilus assembly protein PilF
MIREAIRLDPNLAEAHYLLAKIYLALSRKGSAIEQYKKLQSLDAGSSAKLYREIFNGEIIDAVEGMRLRK